MQYSSLSFRAVLAVLLAAVSTTALASAFGVAPIRVELKGAAKTAIVTVTNDSEEPLVLNMKAVSWDMAEDGTERYEETTELAFFPKSVTVPPGQKRVVRVGAEVPVSGVEKTYRLFLNEMQAAGALNKPRAQVAVLVNFGVPVFLKPPGVQAVLVGTSTASKGKLEVKLQNTGTASARLETVRFAKGAALSFGSAYVLAGRTRVLNLAVTAADCARGLQQGLELVNVDDTVTTIAVDLTAACE